jgi:membrane-anchored protein YejM (alkaline phosphatase superfamily)
VPEAALLFHLLTLVIAFIQMSTVYADCYCFQRAGLLLAGTAWSLCYQVTTAMVLVATVLHLAVAVAAA